MYLIDLCHFLRSSELTVKGPRYDSVLVMGKTRVRSHSWRMVYGTTIMHIFLKLLLPHTVYSCRIIQRFRVYYKLRHPVFHSTVDLLEGLIQFSHTRLA